MSDHDDDHHRHQDQGQESGHNDDRGHAKTYAIEIGDENLQFKPGKVADPVPTGRQIVEAAGFHPAGEYIAFHFKAGRVIEELRPDETVDLRDKGVERFLIFKTDRTFRFEIDDRFFDWGAESISGLVLKTLAGVDPATYGVWLEVRGSDDRLIKDSDTANLAAKGVERFFTGIIQTTEG